jgi:LEA14-like dessication related protein
LSKVGVLLILLFAGSLAYLLLLYYSAASVEVSVESVRLPGLGDLLNFAATRRLSFDVYLKAEGKGPLPVTLRSFSFRVYLEGVYVGVVSSSELVEVKPGEASRVRATLTVDASSLSAQDLAEIVQSVQDHNGELAVTLDGRAEVVALLFVVSVPVRYDSYVLLGPALPRIERMAWKRASCEAGETVEFEVVVVNVFRSHPLEGLLEVSVREDVAFAPDREARRYAYRLALAPGERGTVTGAFETYSGVGTKGFFLRVSWDGTVLGEQPPQYPPRLRVTAAPPPQGTLVVESAWWTVSGRVVTTARVGQTVTAHVRVRAVGGRVEELVRVRVRKDLALRPDEDYAVSTFTVKLESGQSAELTVVFVASEKSGLLFRGYFIEVDFLYSRRKWTMDDAYPPRLKVEG